MANPYPAGLGNEFSRNDTTTGNSVVVLVNSDIPSGNCSESDVLTDNPTQLPCSAPATRVFVGLSKALRHEFVPLPSK